MGEHGSYTNAAAAVGLDYPALVNRLVDVACTRYFGAPRPPELSAKALEPDEQLFAAVVARRDELEKRIGEWVRLSSRSTDPVGLKEAVKRLSERLTELGLTRCDELTDERSAWTWQTAKGLAGGTLLVAHLDVPLGADVPVQTFRRDAEWLYGEGVGGRSALVTIEFALRALRRLRRLRKLPIGVLFYTDEGRDARYSGAVIRKACAQAGRVLVMRPGNLPDKVLTQRRGVRKYRFTAEGAPRRVGQRHKKPLPLRWMCRKIDELAQLSSRKERLAIGVVDLQTRAYPTLLPHQASATLLMSYLAEQRANEFEQQIRELLGRDGVRWEFELISDRPPMPESDGTKALVSELQQLAERRDIPLGTDSSMWPSVAGLVPSGTPVLCGMGPVAVDVNRPQEAVQRISVVQRTVLLAELLLGKHGA
jgi:D-alanine-D-alanine ligase